MHTTPALLDMLRDRLALSSDGQLAAYFHVSRQRISEYRRGLHSLSDDRALAVAAALDLDPAAVLVSMQAERAARAENSPVYCALRDAVARLTKAAAAIAYAAILSGFFASDFADAIVMTQRDNNTDYLLLILASPALARLCVMFVTMLASHCAPALRHAIRMRQHETAASGATGAPA